MSSNQVGRPKGHRGSAGAGPLGGQAALEAALLEPPVGGSATKAGASITEHRLENGMQVLLARRPADPVVTVMTWYRVGARNEREHEAGISHFLEHMMFKGSAKFGKGVIDRTTTELGGQNNAFTGYDHTAYWFELASDRWETALALEADRMASLTLDPEEFDSERAVVLEELSMGKDDPWRNLAELVQGTVFRSHPYRRPIIGYPETLGAMSVDLMRDYHARFYHPGNATLVLCGDLDPEVALAAVERHFGCLPSGPSFEEADCFRMPIEEPQGEQRVETTWEDPGTRVCIAWPTVAVNTDDDYRLDLVSSVLTAGRTSRLHRRLVLDEGLALNISANNDTRIDGGIFWLYAECATGVTPERLIRAIDEELTRIATERVPAPELKRVKSILEASEAYSTETASDLAEQLGEFAIDAEWRVALTGPERIQAVTAKEIQACAAQFLGRGRRVVGVSLPRDVSLRATEEEPVAKKNTRKKKVARKAGKKKVGKKKSWTSTVKKKSKATRRKKASSKKVGTKKRVTKKKAAKPSRKKSAKKKAARKTATRRAGKKIQKKSAKKKATRKKSAKGVARKKAQKKTQKKTTRRKKTSASTSSSRKAGRGAKKITRKKAARKSNATRKATRKTTRKKGRQR